MDKMSGSEPALDAVLATPVYLLCLTFSDGSGVIHETSLSVESLKRKQRQSWYTGVKGVSVFEVTLKGADVTRVSDRYIA